MNRSLLTLSLTGLLLAGCVTPSASVTDLTKKNIQTAEDMRLAQQASLSELGQFLTELEETDLALLKEVRTKVDRIAEEAMRNRAELLRGQLSASFEEELQRICGKQFDQRVAEGFTAPFKRSLAEDSRALSELATVASQFPDDLRAREDFRVARQLHEGLKVKLSEKTLELYRERDRRREDVRMNFLRKMDSALSEYRARSEGASGNQDRSLSSILTEVEVEQVEPRPISFDEHRLALEAWGEASLARLDSHKQALVTTDSYLRGKRLSFLFLEGAEEIPPLDLPPVPTVDTLGLGEVLAQIEAREQSLGTLQVELEQVVRQELSEAEGLLDAAIKLLGKELDDALPPDLPR